MFKLQCKAPGGVRGKAVEAILSAVSAALWGAPLLVMLFGTHIFMTFRLRGVQRHVFRAVRLSVTGEKGKSGDVSPFSALMTALAATIGTGNIVGVATAVAAGGPGAVFWMWISGILGMSTKYAESLLSVKYRIKTPDGDMSGGPMYVMERGLKMKWLGRAFALFTAVAAVGIGAMVQSNSISSVFKTAFKIPPLLTGIVVSVLAGCVILGGIKSIARVCNFIIPAAGISFIFCNLLILFIGREQIPHTLSLIVTSAFTGQAAIGGFAGTTAKHAMRLGISRGLFSNEAGLGSEPIVAAAARTDNPVRQALISMTGTFWDTVVLAAITGIMIVNSGEWISGASGGELTSRVFGVLPAGDAILALCLFTFAFATCIGWSYYAQKAVEYLFGRRAVKFYKAFYVFLIFIGALFSLNAVWSFSDIANALMAVPNLFSVLMLSGEAAKETRAAGL
jgi:AGCS family alanine or glycine:cation symporter